MKEETSQLLFRAEEAIESADILLERAIWRIPPAALTMQCFM
jgi:hypothetical protein